MTTAELETLAALVAERVAQTPAPALLTAAQASELLNVPATWLLAEARADRVPNVPLGRYRRFPRRELLDWAAQRTRGPRGRS